jgi:hypothetical protein
MWEKRIMSTLDMQELRLWCLTHFEVFYKILEKVKIEALKGKIFNFNENNENHKVYPSACVHFKKIIL